LGNFCKLLFSGEISNVLENNSPIFYITKLKEKTLVMTHGINNFWLVATEIGFPKG
jgi:hypothetical protein